MKALWRTQVYVLGRGRTFNRDCGPGNDGRILGVVANDDLTPVTLTVLDNQHVLHAVTLVFTETILADGPNAMVFDPRAS